MSRRSGGRRPRRSTGITPFVTNNADFYRVDTAFVVPRLTTDDWQLQIHGMVDNEITLSYADLIAMPSIERMITLTCVSNEVGGDLAGNAMLAGRPDRRRAEAGGPAEPAPTACCPPASTASPSPPRWRR